MRFSSADGGGVVGMRRFLGRFNFTKRSLSRLNATSRFRAWEASSSANPCFPAVSSLTSRARCTAKLKVSVACQTFFVERIFLFHIFSVGAIGIEPITFRM